MVPFFSVFVALDSRVIPKMLPDTKKKRIKKFFTFSHSLCLFFFFFFLPLGFCNTFFSLLYFYIYIKRYKELNNLLQTICMDSSTTQVRVCGSVSKNFFFYYTCLVYVFVLLCVYVNVLVRYDLSETRNYRCL